MNRTGFLSHELFYWHDTGRWAGVYMPGPTSQPLEHVESEASKRRIESLLAVSGVIPQLQGLEPRPATDDELCRVHTPAYIDRLEKLAANGGGEAGPGTPMGYHSAEAARLAAGGAITAVEAAFADGPRRTYCLLRPPGHHAERESAIGFCLYNSVAIAAHAAKDQGARRVAIIDWDVHHGNGTQQAFWDDPDTLFVSIHQDGLFPPGSGAIEQSGGDGAPGGIINVPLPPGSGHGAYLAAFDRVVVPAVDAFEPAIILISAGQDGGFYDPMARQMCLAETYQQLTARVLDLANRHAEGRLVALHEGGYSPFQTPFLTAAVVCELASLPHIPDPSSLWTREVPGQELQPHQDERIEAVLAHHRPFGLLG